MNDDRKDMPNGFRDSTGEASLRPDLGPLPEGWQVVRLGVYLNQRENGIGIRNSNTVIKEAN
jgi:hypothetical protein